MKRFIQKTDGYSKYFVNKDTGEEFRVHDIVDCSHLHPLRKHPPYAIKQFSTNVNPQEPQLWTSNTGNEFTTVLVEIMYGSETHWVRLDSLTRHKPKSDIKKEMEKYLATFSDTLNDYDDLCPILTPNNYQYLLIA